MRVSGFRGRWALVCGMCSFGALACGGGGVAAPADAGPDAGFVLDAGPRVPTALIVAPARADVLTEIRLDGSTSTAPGGARITDYSWTLPQKPDGSAAQLRNATDAVAFFTPDKAGLYEVRLGVFVGIFGGHFVSATITVSDDCCRPVARVDAATREVTLGNTLSLDGRASSDPRNQMLSYAWLLRALGDGGLADGGVQTQDGGAMVLGGATLRDTTSPVASFTPDPLRPHAQYQVELRVTNAQNLVSHAVSVSIAVRNSRPSVRLEGPSGTVSPGTPVPLSAIGTDADNDALDFRWRILDAPMGAALNIGTPNSGALLITVPERITDYRVEVIASDGFEDSAPATLTVSTGNGPPVVEAGAPQSVPHTCDSVGTCRATARLSGTATDPDGDLLTFAWDALGVLPGLDVAFQTPSDAATDVTLTSSTTRPVTGDVSFRFRARDAFHDFIADFTTVTVVNQAPTVTATAPARVEHEAVGGERVYRAIVNLAADGRDPEYRAGAETAPYLLYAWSGPASGERPDAATALAYDAVLNQSSRTPRITLTRDCRDGSCGAAIGGLTTAPFVGNYTLHVQTLDLSAASGQGTVTFALGNRAPSVVISGSSGVAANGTLPLTANGTDPDSDPLSYTWELVRQPQSGATLMATGGSATLQASAATTGTYEVRVTVKDDFGATASASKVIAVNAAPTVTLPASFNTGHTCNASGACSANTVSVSGGVADPEGDALTLEWRFVPSVTRPAVTCDFVTRDAQSTSVSCAPGPDGAIAGTYTLQLCAKDALHDFVCGSSSLIIGNQAPTARVDGPSSGALSHIPYDGGGERLATIPLLASGTDPEFGGTGTPPYLRYRWTLVSQADAAAAVSFIADQQNPVVTIRRTCPCADTPLLGSYRFQLVVTDPNGLASAAVEKTVDIVNARPTVSASATLPATGRVRAGVSVPLSSTATDSNSDTLTYAWSLVTQPTGANATFTGASSAQATLHTTAGALLGSYVARVVVSDGYESATADVTIPVNRPPSVAPTTTLSLTTESCGDGSCSASVSVSAGATDPEDSAAQLTYSWSATGPTVGAFQNATSGTTSFTVSGAGIKGTYTLTVTATDRDGESATASTQWIVDSRPPTQPTLTLSAPTVNHFSFFGPPNSLPGTYRVLAQVTLSATSTDPETTTGANRNLTWLFTNTTKPAGSSATAVFATPTVVPGQPATVVVDIYQQDIPAPCPVVTPLTGFTGQWGFRAIAVDPNGLQSPQSLEAVVTVANRPPGGPLSAGSAIPNQNHTYVGGARPYSATIPFDGAPGSDPDGNPVCHRWEFESAPVADSCFVGAAGCATTLDVSGSLPGSVRIDGQQGMAGNTPVRHVLCLAAVDFFGQSARSCRQVSVGNRAPTVSASAPGTRSIDLERLDVGQPCTLSCGTKTFTLSATVNDPDGDPVTVSWAKVTGGVCSTSTPADCSASCSRQITVDCGASYSGGGSAGYSATVVDPFGVSVTSSATSTTFTTNCLGTNGC